MAIIEAIYSRTDLFIVALVVFIALVILVIDLIYLAATASIRRRRIHALRAGRKNLGESPALEG